MDQRTQDREGLDRQSIEDRRHTDRRHSLIGVRPSGLVVERRRSNRRNIAGAGLLAALALGGVRYQQYRLEPTDPMEDVSRDLGPPELQGDDATVDAQVDQREALEPIIQEAALLHGVDLQSLGCFNDFGNIFLRSPAT